MKGYKTVIFGILIAVTGALSTPEMQAFVAMHIPSVSGFLGLAVILLRTITTSPVFKDDDGASSKPPPGAGLVLLLLLPLALSSCKAISAPSTEYTADSSVYTVLTAEKMVLSRPCTSVVTTACVDKGLARKLKESRLALVAALKVYQDARDAYIAGGAQGGDAAVMAAYQSLSGALTAVQNILALPGVEAIMAKVKG